MKNLITRVSVFVALAAASPLQAQDSVVTLAGPPT